MSKRFAWVLVLLALFAGACGRGGEPRRASGFAARAADAGTFKVEGTSRGNLGTNSRMTAVVDLRRSLRYVAIELQAAGSPPGLSGDWELISTPEHFFWKTPRRTAEGEPWGRMTIGDLEEYGAAGEPLMTVFNPAPDPDAFFAVLDQVAKDLKEVGSEEVRGVDTTEFSTLVNLQKLARLVPAKHRKQLLELSPTLPMRLFVGEDGLLYRHTYALERRGERIEWRFDLYDYGIPVDIREPGPDEYVDIDPNKGSTKATYACNGTPSRGSTTTTEDC